MSSGKRDPRKRRRRRAAAGVRRRHGALAKANRVRTLDELLAWSSNSLGKWDVALLNLVCALGLPGAENMDAGEILETLDDWAEQVKVKIHENYQRLLHSPGGFHNSQAYFCVIYLVTVLQEQFGVRYNPKWQGMTPDSPMPPEFGKDSKDLFIHAITDGIGGTCGSLPVVYAAVGRRLRYPLKLVKADRHLFLRWDDPRGKHWYHPERFNVEVTTPGVHCLPDEHYKTWPHELPAEDIQAGIYLKSLTPREELAEFLAQRAACLRRNGRIAEMVETYRWAAKLVPNNYYFQKWHEQDAAWLKTLRRGHSFLNAPIDDPFYRGPKGAHWVNLPGGKRVLVQVVQPGYGLMEVDGFKNLGCHTVHEHVHLPNGSSADAEVPVYNPGNPMKAEWVRLRGGQYALVHKPQARPLGPPTPQRPPSSFDWQRQRTHKQQPEPGQPVLPNEWPTAFPPAGNHRVLEPQEQYAVENAIQQMNLQDLVPSLPTPDRLALPPGPGPPRLEPPVPKLTV